LLAIPLFIIDSMLLAAAPGTVTRFYSWNELFPLLGGFAAYCVVRIAIRKPERLYLWGHELTHLIVAKLFLKTVHGFHITSRDGGKVVIDGTNVWIDLAPYLLPFYNLLLLAAAMPFPLSAPWGTTSYLVGTGFLFGMHVAFSAEGFLQAQPDLTRSGRPFSLALTILFIAGIIPLLTIPGLSGGWAHVRDAYAAWGGAAIGKGGSLFLAGRAAFGF
jgi:hypothetical protein